MQIIEYENIENGKFYLFHLSKGDFKWQKRGQVIMKEEKFCIVRLVPLGLLERTERKDVDKIFQLEHYEV